MHLKDIDLRKLNSITKYPSIPTFHVLGDKGRLTEQHLPLPDRKIIVTEKIDGTNGRIIFLPKLFQGPGWIIGSREELLCAEGDLIGDPALGIVKALRPLAEQAVANRPRADLAVFYGEVFGGKTSAAAKIYTATGAVGYRIFDVMKSRSDEIMDLLQLDCAAIAKWRDAGGQTFLDDETVRSAAETLGWERVPSLPAHYDLPVDIAGAHGWLRTVAPLRTRAALDGEGGRSEGVIIRTADRSFIAKLRFEDYERTTKQTR